MLVHTHVTEYTNRRAREPRGPRLRCLRLARGHERRHSLAPPFDDLRSRQITERHSVTIVAVHTSRRRTIVLARARSPTSSVTPQGSEGAHSIENGGRDSGTVRVVLPI